MYCRPSTTIRFCPPTSPFVLVTCGPTVCLFHFLAPPSVPRRSSSRPYFLARPRRAEWRRRRPERGAGRAVRSRRRGTPRRRRAAQGAVAAPIFPERFHGGASVHSCGARVGPTATRRLCTDQHGLHAAGAAAVLGRGQRRQQHCPTLAQQGPSAGA